MGGAESLSWGLAFAAGLVSFFSPCCLPLVPSYLSFLAGSSAGASSPRFRIVLHSLGFILGFSLVFVLLGMTASSVGSFLRSNLSFFRQLAGIVVVAFGLHTMGFLPLPFLQRGFGFSSLPGGGKFWSSLLVGGMFSLGWSPCVGPILASILILASQAGSVLAGGRLLLAYSLGLGVPFFLVALSLGFFGRSFLRPGPFLEKVRFVGGVLLVVMGLLIFFNYFSVLSRFVPGWVI